MDTLDKSESDRDDAAKGLGVLRDLTAELVKSIASTPSDDPRQQKRALEHRKAVAWDAIREILWALKPDRRDIATAMRSVDDTLVDLLFSEAEAIKEQIGQEDDAIHAAEERDLRRSSPLVI